LACSIQETPFKFGPFSRFSCYFWIRRGWYNIQMVVLVWLMHVIVLCYAVIRYSFGVGGDLWMFGCYCIYIMFVTVMRLNCLWLVCMCLGVLVVAIFWWCNNLVCYRSEVLSWWINVVDACDVIGTSWWSGCYGIDYWYYWALCWWLLCW